jgi:hypothetical protein
MNYKKLASLILFITLLHTYGCVDIPEKGITPPDYRNQVRIVNAFSGMDTIRRTIGVDSTFLLPDSSLYSRVTTYQDYETDFSMPSKVWIDNVNKATLNIGEGTSYLNIAAGSRRFALSMDVKVIDTMWRYDTIQVSAGVKLRIGTRDSLAALATPLTMPDFKYYEAILGLSVDRKGTVYLHAATDIGSRATFLTERYTFEPEAPKDTAKLRLINTIPGTSFDFVLTNATSLIKRTIASDVDYMTPGDFGYQMMRLRTDSTYTVHLVSNGTTTIVDSLTNVVLSPRNRYSFFTTQTTGGVTLHRLDD